VQQAVADCPGKGVIAIAPRRDLGKASLSVDELVEKGSFQGVHTEPGSPVFVFSKLHGI
jgi:hypothetical protein